MARREDRSGATGAIRLVAGREVRERLRARSFYVSTGLLVVLILAMGVISGFVDGGGPSELDVGVVEPAAAELEPALAEVGAAFDREVAVNWFDDVDAALHALEAGDIGVVLDPGDRRVWFDDGISNEVLSIVQQAWSGVEIRQSLVATGLELADIDDVLRATPLEAVTLDGDGEVDGLAILTGTIAAILLFVSLQTFGTYVLTGVVEEKSTAVIEILLVRADPSHLLAGKIIGIGVAAMAQFSLAVMAGLVSLRISGVTVPSEVWSAVPMAVVWFLGGYALYSTLFALAGSLVSRQEDAQAAATPIFTALIGGYLLVFIFGYVPESTASTVMSMIPFIAPLLMPMRMAAGAASMVEVVVALVLLVAAIWAVWKLASRIFEQVLLNRGSRISWRNAAAYIRSQG